MSESYKTVAAAASDEFTEQRSRFIGYVCPVQTEEQALAFIEEKKNVFKCVFCGTSYYLDKPTTKNKIKVINNTYNVYGNHDNSDQTSINHLVKSANYFLIKLKNYDKAKDLFERITIEAPHDYRGWWGLICAENYNLNSRLAFENEHDPHEYEEESENFRSITIAAPKTIAQKLLETWDNYLQGYHD